MKRTTVKTETSIARTPCPETMGARLRIACATKLLLLLLLLLATANLSAGIPNGPVVSTVCGGGPSPYYGYVQGNPLNSTDAQFHTPIGLAMDNTGEYLFVADRDNNAIRVVDLFSSSDYYYFTYTFAPIANVTPAGVISKPVGVVVDACGNVYVLNRGSGTNGTVVAVRLERESPRHERPGPDQCQRHRAGFYQQYLRHHQQQHPAPDSFRRLQRHSQRHQHHRR